jgi:DNA-binding MarR family transcriptional regulator
MSTVIVPIEEEIKQKRSFKNLEEKALVNIMYTHGWVLERMRLFFKDYGITNKQYNILRILKGAEQPLSTSQIRHRMLDKMSDTTRLINRMITKGWVKKSVSKTDRRLVDIMITDEGLDLLDEIRGIDVKAREIFNNLSEDEIQKLSDLLDKVRLLS